VDNRIEDAEVTLGESLRRTIAAIQGDSITVQELLVLIGEQGLLLFCMILTLPFVLPVSIPGVSTVFGLVIILIGISLTLGRMLWLPERLGRRKIVTDQLVPVLERGVRMCERLERWMRTRLDSLTQGRVMNRVNGLMLTAGGVLLLFPLSFVPFSNTLPAVAVMLLAMGMLQRDGYFVVGGYVFVALTVVYFVGLALLVVLGGQSLLQ
jgi:hypothetical protein